MTSQTKQYIEFSDIVALHGQCKRCGATVSLPLAAKLLRTEGLSRCPNCNEAWAEIFESNSILPSINEFIEHFKQIQNILARRRELSKDGGFILMLEIKQQP